MVTKIAPDDNLKNKRFDVAEPVKEKQAEIKADKLEVKDSKRERNEWLKAIFGFRWRKHKKQFPVNTKDFDYEREKESKATGETAAKEKNSEGKEN